MESAAATKEKEEHEHHLTRLYYEVRDPMIAQSILDIKFDENKQKFYLIRWFGRNQSYDSWECEKSFPDEVLSHAFDSLQL